MEYCPTEEMWSDILTKPLQGRSYRIMKFKLVNMTELYVDTSENASEKVSKALGVSTKKKQVEFNQYLRMKYIPNIPGVQTESVKSSRHTNKPTSLTSICRGVLAKLCSDKGTDKHNGGHYKKGREKHSDGHYGT